MNNLSKQLNIILDHVGLLVGQKEEIKFIDIYRKKREEYGIKKLIMIVEKELLKIDSESKESLLLINKLVKCQESSNHLPLIILKLYQKININHE